jgi:hypothetical protein
MEAFITERIICSFQMYKKTGWFLSFCPLSWSAKNEIIVILAAWKGL